MRLKARELLKFAGRFLLIFSVLTVVWLAGAPLYGRLVALLTVPIFAITENPPLTTLEFDGDNIHGIISKTSAAFTIRREFYYLNYSGILLLLALMGAIPLRFKQYARLIPIAVLGILVFHAFIFLSYIRIQYIVKGIIEVSESEFNFYIWLEMMTRGTGRYIFPLVLWALLTFRYWFPKPVASTAVPTPQTRKQHRTKETHP